MIKPFMKRVLTNFIFVVSFIYIFTYNAKAQKTEIGAMVGGAMYYGDIINDFILNSSKGSAGLFIRYHLNEDVSVKYAASYCRVGGADSTSSSDYQKNRNLSFWSDIFEASVQLEFNFVKDIIRGRRLRNRFIPYATVGLGAFSFWSYATNPNTGLPVKLKSLHTEGLSYAPYGVCLPIGLGLKYKITSNITLGLEANVRFTNTTYIDDIGGVTATYPSQKVLRSLTALVMYDRSKARYNPATGYSGGNEGGLRGKIAINDIYALFGVSLSYRIEFVKFGVNHGKSVLKLRYF
ncbi:MAG: DUF6089 family protein [Bacteroidota bacterium]